MYIYRLPTQLVDCLTKGLEFYLNTLFTNFIITWVGCKVATLHNYQTTHTTNYLFIKPMELVVHNSVYTVCLWNA